MKTLFALLATASIVAAPLAASAQDHHGGGGGRGQWNGAGNAGAPANPAPVQAAPAPPAPVQAAPNNGGRGGFQGRGGGQQFQQPQQQQQQQRNFGGGDRSRDFAGRGGQGGSFDRRGDDHRDDDRRDFGRGDRDRRGFTGFDYRQTYAYRGYDRGYNNRSFRWGVGAFLPRTYWNSYFDSYAYGLGAAPYGYRWVVVDGEALLIDNYTGAVVQALWL
jgi:Ni/Co efflux regulator RcnB